MKPRYWLRVEDYRDEATATRRAEEYRSVGAYEPVAKAYGKENAFMLSKTSVRIWAIPRGKRVYALTTDTYLFTLIETQNNLRNAIAALPSN